MLPLFIMAIENDTDRQFVAGCTSATEISCCAAPKKILRPRPGRGSPHEAMLRVIRSLERVRQIPAEELLPYLVTIVQTASTTFTTKPTGSGRPRRAGSGTGPRA